MDTMNKSQRPMSFRRQMQQSMSDLQSIMSKGQSPSGNGRFTVRTIEVIEPSEYDTRSIRRLRQSLNLSQALFARLLGVSGALVRAWELGTRQPAAIARRLLDQIRSNPSAFALLVRSSSTVANSSPTRSAKNAAISHSRKVA
jgi:putative transcriptional regulator